MHPTTRCILGSMLNAVTAAALAQPPAVEVPMDASARHQLAALRQAAGHRTAMALLKARCGRTSERRSVVQAGSALDAAEVAYRAALDAPQRPSREALQLLVVERECAAFQASLTAPQVQRPAWWLSSLQITALGVDAPSAGGFWAEAVARNAEGPVVGSRITFSQGSHMSCFGITDTRGIVRCNLVDTHPHGPGPMSAADLASHSGPLIASLAGSVSATRIELPAVAERAMPTPFARRIVSPLARLWPDAATSTARNDLELMAGAVTLQPVYRHAGLNASGTGRLWP